MHKRATDYSLFLHICFLIIFCHSYPINSKKVALSDNLLSFFMLIFLLSANYPPLYVRLNCGVFLLLPNLPAYKLAKMSDF